MNTTLSNGPRPVRPGDSAPRVGPRPWWLKILRTIGIAIVAASVSLYLFAISPWSPRDVPDNLEDTAFELAAEPRCAVFQAELNALPRAGTATSPAERADVLEQANTILSAMVLDLRPVVTGSESDRQILVDWLDDWDLYIADRANHVERLRTLGDVPFQVTERYGRQISRPIDRVAQVNNMVSCATPGDLG